MGHAHWSSSCPGCTEITARMRGVPEVGLGQAALSHISTEGLDHIFASDDQHNAPELLVAHNLTDDPLDCGDRVALNTVADDRAVPSASQAARLEAASYRIGYLEAVAAHQQEQIARLTDNSTPAIENKLAELTARLELLEARLSPEPWWHKLAGWLRRVKGQDDS